MNLYINACVREKSRTDFLAKKLLAKLGDYCEVKLEDEDILPLKRHELEYRTELIGKGDYSDRIFYYAKQFAQADNIVISAPFWDLSFPSLLKLYIENIYVTGLTARYGDDGRPVGMCRANTLYYVSTAGGSFDGSYSYRYIDDLARNHFGIRNTELIYAEMLDIQGFDPEQILRECVKRYNLE